LDYAAPVADELGIAFKRGNTSYHT